MQTDPSGSFQAEVRADVYNVFGSTNPNPVGLGNCSPTKQPTTVVAGGRVVNVDVYCQIR